MKSFFSWATEINLENLFVLSVKINGIVKQKKKSCMFNKLYYVHDNNSFMTLLPFFLLWLSSNFEYHGNQSFLLSSYLVSVLRKKISSETEAKRFQHRCGINKETMTMPRNAVISKLMGS